jgi:hypothetical protein
LPDAPRESFGICELAKMMDKGEIQLIQWRHYRDRCTNPAKALQEILDCEHYACSGADPRSFNSLRDSIPNFPATIFNRISS